MRRRTRRAGASGLPPRLEAGLRAQRVARLRAVLPDPHAVMPDDTPAHPYQTSLARYRLAGAERRGNGLPLARAPGAEGTDDQPSAHLLKGASTPDSEPLSRELRRVADLGSAGDRELVVRPRLEVVGVGALVQLARGSPERRFTMRPRFTAGR
jgi:hypothetical protein